MKSLLTIGSILLLSSIGSAQAVTFNNSDGSRLTAVCIASAESEKALNLKAREHGFSQKDLDSFTCNGLSVQEFGQKYRGMTSEETVKVYAFERTGDNRETELCVAAATSNEAYKAVKAKLFSGSTVNKIQCNGLPIDKFARRYGNKGFKM